MIRILLFSQQFSGLLFCCLLFKPLASRSRGVVFSCLLVSLLCGQQLLAKELPQNKLGGDMTLADADLIFSPPKPVLSAQDEQSLRLSVEAANAPRYPVQEADRTLHLYGGGRPTLICSPLKLCVIELQDGERVVKSGIHLGDTVRWKITPTVGEGKKTFLVIKPTGSGLESNLVIITDRHSYDVRLVSQPGARISRLAWSYPDETRQAWQDYYADQAKDEKATEAHASANTIKPDVAPVEAKIREGNAMSDRLERDAGGLGELDFNYRISGCKSCNWRPVRVYNNSVQTVVELPDLRGKEAPAFLVLGQDQARMVNYRILGNRYIVDQVFDKAVLVLGVGKRQERVEIFRTVAASTERYRRSTSIMPVAKPAAKRGQYYVQLLNAVDPPSARSHQLELQAMGYRVELQPMYGQALPALRVGPWRDSAGANSALQQLRQHYQRASLWEESS